MSLDLQQTPEKAIGYVNVSSQRAVQQILEMADAELVRYGNPPSEIHAEFKDGDGHVYKGTLYLVTEEKQ